MSRTNMYAQLALMQFGVFLGRTLAGQNPAEAALAALIALVVEWVIYYIGRLVYNDVNRRWAES